MSVEKVSLQTLHITTLIFLVFLTLGGGQIAMAQDRITEQAIRSFYKESAEIQMEEKDTAVAYFKKHLAEDAVLMVRTITNMEGVPPQKQEMKFNKKEMVEETERGYQYGRVQKIENTVLRVDIAEDGKSARVKDSSFAIMSINIPGPQGNVPMKSENSILCDDTIVLGANGVLQIKDSVCNMEVSMEMR